MQSHGECAVARRKCREDVATRTIFSQMWSLLLAIVFFSSMVEAWGPSVSLFPTHARIPVGAQHPQKSWVGGRGGWRRCTRAGVFAGLHKIVASAAPGLGQKIDGKAMAETVRERVKVRALALAEEFGQPPCLAVVIIGERKDSQVLPCYLHILCCLASRADITPCAGVRAQQGEAVRELRHPLDCA